jgi:hypothetical protein
LPFVAFCFSGPVTAGHGGDPVTQVFRGALVATMLIGAANLAAAQQAPPTPGPAQNQPAAPPAPAVPPASSSAAQLPVTVAPPSLGPSCPVPVPPATAPTRAFTVPTGILLHQVAATRVADFERLIGYVQDALAKTTNATLRNQAKGWRFYKDLGAGPNGDALFVFMLDPAVPCVDYALGPILAEAYPDPAQLTEIWNLYRSSVRGGGTIMNLVPVEVKPPAPIVTPPSTPVAPVAPAPATEKPTGPATQKPGAPRP